LSTGVTMSQLFRGCFPALLVLVVSILQFITNPGYAADVNGWITTWAASPQGRWNDDLPAPFGIAESIDNQTVRQTARVSVGGGKVRIVLSNEYGARPLTIGAATVAIAKEDGSVEKGSEKPLTWNGQSSVVVPPKAPIVSDPVELSVKALGSLSVSVYFPKKMALSTVHWDGAQTAYVSGPGDFTTDPQFKPEMTTRSRLFLSRILVDATADAKAVVFFGDSITDGACSSPDQNNRWPDYVAERLQAAGQANIAVVNEAISGNRVLSDGMGINALSRFNADVLSHPRVATLVIMEGINDIGWPGEKSVTPDEKQRSKDEIILGYKQLIDRAHTQGIRVVAATLTPFIDTFKGSPMEGYYTAEKEKIRLAVNEWIRTSGAFDGVIDFDKTTEDPNKPGYIRADYDCGDHLHPNDAGYKAMADSVDLDMLVAK
jgi:lysophospholipase L1-like esterase